MKKNSYNFTESHTNRLIVRHHLDEFALFNFEMLIYKKKYSHGDAVHNQMEDEEKVIINITEQKYNHMFNHHLLDEFALF